MAAAIVAVASDGMSSQSVGIFWVVGSAEGCLKFFECSCESEGDMGARDEFIRNLDLLSDEVLASFARCLGYPLPPLQEISQTPLVGPASRGAGYRKD